MGLGNLFKRSKPKKETKVVVVELKKPKNFKYLDELINSGEEVVNLDADIILGDDEKYKYISGIKVEPSKVIVNGNGHTIDARGKTRIFDIGSHVTFRNVTFKNGFSQKEGGAFHCIFATVKFEGCTFENNVSEKYGGAICNNGFSVTIVESVFKNNKVVGDFGRGGAIYSPGDLTVLNSKFLENTIDVISGSGQAISSHGNLMVIGCKFTQYEVSHYAEPIENMSKNSVIENCEFYGNC